MRPCIVLGLDACLSNLNPSLVPHTLTCPPGKILVTSIAENEKFLNELFGTSPVPFKPSKPHLVYQYKLYTNFTPVTAALNELNPEIPEDD